MEARILVTLVDILLTVNTLEALAALTPEAGHQVVTSPVLIWGKLFIQIKLQIKKDYFCFF